MNKNGFTLIELLVVVAIIGILATIILSSLNTARAKARDANRQQDIATIQNALEIYYLDNGHYPNSTGMGGFSPSVASSYNASWEALETMMGVTLPRDPINEVGHPISEGKHNYLYASNNAAFCNNQEYVIYYLPETFEAPADQRFFTSPCTGATIPSSNTVHGFVISKP